LSRALAGEKERKRKEKRRKEIKEEEEEEEEVKEKEKGNNPKVTGGVYGAVITSGRERG